MDFVALDVETANPDLASICQIGFAEYQNGRLVRSWGWLVNPEDYFHGVNVSIHGIDDRAVRNEPAWPHFHEQICRSLQGRIIVSHTAFDRASLQRVCNKYRLSPIEGIWLDSASVVRRTWPQYSRSGYGLSQVANDLGISFRHHNAEEDARAAGEILLRAIQHSGVSISDWLARSKHAIGATDGSSSVRRNGCDEGPLFGEVVVFTGALSVTRQEAADLAAKAGCDVAPTVNRNTTLLVVGDQDIQKLTGHEKSSKHRKAEELITQGQPIRILSESDFRELLSSVS